MNVSELKNQRAGLIAKGQAILDAATAANRAPTREESALFERYMDDADAIEQRYAPFERLAIAKYSLEQRQGRRTTAGQPGRMPDGEYRGAVLEAKDAELRTWEAHCSAEHRALSSGNDAQGGYLTAPAQVVGGILKAVDNAVVMRQLATVIPLRESGSLGLVSLDADPADSDWTAELGTGSEDSTMAFGKRELHPRPLAKRIKVSRTLLRQAPSGGNLVQERLSYKFGIAAESAYLTGDGATKPLGIFVASSDGIDTSRDVSTGSTTSITADSLIDCLYSLKAGYLRSPSLRWIFHRDGVRQIRKLKTGDGQYIWQPGLGDAPDTILGVPVIMSEYAPNTFTTGQYVGVLGDFSYYYIADALTMTVQRLEELYAETNQVGFIGRLETDGMPALAEAFARVKLA